MISYVFAPPAVSSVAIQNSTERFPVRRIFCVGRNYSSHAREMGQDPEREPPFIFMKPADTVVESGSKIAYPPETSNLHYEIELIVAIDKNGRNIPQAESLNYVFGYASGIDFTRRDLQLAAKKMGRPWDWGKGFDNSAPCGPIQTVRKAWNPYKSHIWLAVNGVMKQNANIAEMIWTVPEIITFISNSMELRAGDLIYTGTPSGVGATVRGDQIKGGIEGLEEISIDIV